MRQVTLDTETTGLSTKNGDRIVEIGCVEIINRQITGKTFQTYCNPEHPTNKDTFAITGITDQFLSDKPKFASIAENFLKFIDNAELIIHNAAFDVEFINNELQLLNHEIKNISSKFKIVDTLVLARTMHPGQRNNLDALCKRYNINIERTLHGALLDAEILAKLFLKMTAGQINLNFDLAEDIIENLNVINRHGENMPTIEQNKKLKIIYASLEELNLHERYFSDLGKS